MQIRSCDQSQKVNISSTRPFFLTLLDFAATKTKLMIFDQNRQY